MGLDVVTFAVLETAGTGMELDVWGPTDTSPVVLPVGANGDCVSSGPVEHPTVTKRVNEGKSEGAMRR